MVIMLFPATLPIDGTGGYFSLDLVSAPVIGYLLGPFYGTVSVFLGTFIAVVVDPSAAGMMGVFGLLGALLAGIPPATSAIVAGLIRKGRHRVVPLIFIVTIGLFLITFVGLLSFSFLWLHIIALSLSFLFLIPQLKKHLENGLNLTAGTSYSRVAVSIWLLVFISVMADHIVASVMRAYLVLAAPATVVSIIYTLVIFIYPIERILASIAGGFVTFLIAIAITRKNLYLPTRPIAEQEAIPFDTTSQERHSLVDKV